MNNNGKTSLSDIPFNRPVNDFGTERYVDGLIRFIENSSAPITIALQGEWGSGKTSLMNRLERSLCQGENSKFISVGINTWEYSMMSTPEMTVFKIIESLVKALSKDDPNIKKKFKKFLSSAGNFLYRGARESLKLVPMVGGAIGVAVEAAGVPSELPNGADENEAATLTDLKDSLEQAVQKIIGGGKQGVIVFVDDLDRLNPPVAVEILELLKNIFCIENCIFVLAIDYEVVVKGLEPKFGKLTDQNEREFRSFFDKIIQVPFSLPVSSYRPMDFVLDSLVKIDYISDVEKADEHIRQPFQEIVENTVGKNPRSIKRLINTLSLISCISHCGEKDKDAEFLGSREGRIVNFAIVAMQVCYPKIYRMLATMPDFQGWDNSIVARFNVPIKTGDGESAPEWEEILEAACSTDKYLVQHFSDIRTLLNLIKTTLMNSMAGSEGSFDGKIKAIIDKSSVTGISEPVVTGEVDRKRLIYNLHNNVERRIHEKRPDIGKIQCKRNTGNGGFWVQFPDESWTEVIIWPNVSDNKITCQFLLKTAVCRPERLMGKTWSEVANDTEVAKLLAIMDNCVAPLLKDAYYFEGKTYPGAKTGTFFKSFSEEQKFRSENGWQDKLISQEVSYYINLANEALFSDRAVVNTIADVVIALYDYQLAAKSLN